MIPLGAERERERERERKREREREPALRFYARAVHGMGRIIPRELVSFYTRASSNRRVVSRARIQRNDRRRAVERAEVEEGGRAPPPTFPKVDWPCNPH